MATLINVDSTIQSFVSSREACALLGIRRETLYAYASRGFLRSFPGTGKGRDRRYLRDEILRLKARRDARSGHGPVAAGALRWGEPVLDSSITEITPRGPRYRGELAVDLVARGARFEQVAELLWSGTWPDAPPVWAAAAIPVKEMKRLLDRTARPVTRFPLLLAGWAAVAEATGGTLASPEAMRLLAPRLVAALPWVLEPARWRAARNVPHLAERIAILLGCAANAKQVRLIDAILILSADQELTVSSFAARVVASSGADLYAILSAAAAAFSGPLHGTASDAVYEFVERVGHPRHARRMVEECGLRGARIPGFGHSLYRDGDPRAPALLEQALAIAPPRAELRTLMAVAEVAERRLHQRPNLDAALVAAVLSLGLRAPSGIASMLFALGRTAGWIAHAMEQVESGVLIRPRARYVGR